MSAAEEQKASGAKIRTFWQGAVYRKTLGYLYGRIRTEILQAPSRSGYLTLDTAPAIGLRYEQLDDPETDWYTAQHGTGENPDYISLKLVTVTNRTTILLKKQSSYEFTKKGLELYGQLQKLGQQDGFRLYGLCLIHSENGVQTPIPEKTWVPRGSLSSIVLQYEIL